MTTQATQTSSTTRLIARICLAEGLIILAGSLWMALSAQIAVFFPFTVVPFTLQPPAALFLGVILGRRRAAAAVAAYLAEGAMGFPVFRLGGSGVAHLVGPTGGYLVGFLAAAYIVGFLFERGAGNSWVKAFLALLTGNALLLLLGTAWCAVYVGTENALTMGLYPFLINDFLKVIALTTCLSFGYRLRRFVHSLTSV